MWFLNIVSAFLFTAVMASEGGTWNILGLDIPWISSWEVWPLYVVVPMLIVNIVFTVLMAFSTSDDDGIGKAITFFELGSYLLTMLLHWVKVELGKPFIFPNWLCIFLFAIVTLINLGQIAAPWLAKIPSKGMRRE